MSTKAKVLRKQEYTTLGFNNYLLVLYLKTYTIYNQVFTFIATVLVVQMMMIGVLRPLMVGFVCVCVCVCIYIYIYIYIHPNN